MSGDKSQKQQILEYMQSGRRINKYLAFQLFGCMTLAQRVDEIETEIELGEIKNWVLCRSRVKEHNNASEYWMEPEVKPFQNYELFTGMNNADRL